jgi:non-heme Fe2+,alpha-ketoglutarate-dependent halogenase
MRSETAEGRHSAIEESASMGLTLDEVRSYHEDGYISPIRVFDEEETRTLRRRFEALVAHEGGKLSRPTNTRPHLLLKWIDDLIRDPRILDRVEAVLGPNILCWASGFFAKAPGDGTFVSWHQDATYWGLSSNDVVTAWIAFSPSVPATGCLRVVPGSHKRQVPHRDTFSAGNLLSRGQEIAVDVDEASAVDIVLQPGEMSLHHVKMFHGSHHNRARDRRIGFAIRYLPPHVHQQVGPDSATLVRGADRYGYFEPEPAPSRDLDPQAVALHEALRERRTAILMRGAAQPSKAAHTAASPSAM